MNIQVKSSIIIISTLIIGIVLGIVLDRTFMQKPYEKRIAKFRSSKPFIHIFERIIQPSESQREEIRKVIEKHGERIRDLHHETRDEMAAIMDSLKADLDPILTEEQKERLKRSLERARKWGRSKPSWRKRIHPEDDRNEPPRPPVEKDGPRFW